MILDILFNIANLYVTPIWIGIIVFPDASITRKVMSSNLFFWVLLVIFLYFMVATLDLESAEALFNFQLSSLANFLSEKDSAGGAWVHFLIMDLFVGRWIYWEGQEKKIWTAHSLILCLLLGPAGLISHFITDAFFGNDLDDSDDNNSPEKSHSSVAS